MFEVKKTKFRRHCLGLNFDGLLETIGVSPIDHNMGDDCKHHNGCQVFKLYGNEVS
jgi:hypothetical protein